MDLGFYSAKHMKSVDFIGSVIFKSKHVFKLIPVVSKRGPRGEHFSLPLLGRGKALGTVPKKVRAPGQRGVSSAQLYRNKQCPISWERGGSDWVLDLRSLTSPWGFSVLRPGHAGRWARISCTCKGHYCWFINNWLFSRPQTAPEAEEVKSSSTFYLM